jgi:hypothetical protein
VKKKGERREKERGRKKKKKKAKEMERKGLVAFGWCCLSYLRFDFARESRVRLGQETENTENCFTSWKLAYIYVCMYVCR